MRRSVINAIGKLDIDFGRGYGEENDFCMRALKSGYKNLFAHDVFVFHSGEVSFKEFRDVEFESGQALLWRKHPDYVRRVQEYIDADPARVARIRADLYRLAKILGSNTAVLISNPAVGGLDTHLQSLARRLQSSGMNVLIIYVGLEMGENLSLRIFDEGKEIFIPSFKYLRIIADRDLILLFCEWLKPKLLHVHSLATLTWRAMTNIVSILAQFENDYYVTLHDYDSICHRHHLIDIEGQYCEPFNVEKCRKCVVLDKAAKDYVDPIERQRIYATYLSKAKCVFVPSNDTKMRLQSFFPDVPFLVREHEEQYPIYEWERTRRKSGPLRICAIGAIGPHKGSNLLYSLALDAKLRALQINYCIVGYSAISDSMREVGVIETGRYASNEACFALLKEVEPDFILLPSIWPETYCYTLSIALQSRNPIIVFDIGAQAERLRGVRNAIILDRAIIAHPEWINDAILTLPSHVSEEISTVPRFKFYEPFIDEYYGSQSPCPHPEPKAL